ncbi:MAG: peptidylprolyl isomerase [bacterium]
MIFRRCAVIVGASFLFSLGILINSSQAQNKPEKDKSHDAQPAAVAVEAKTQETKKTKNPVVVVETSLGKIKIELFEKEAPLTVKNFLSYVQEKFYDGTIFHRVVPNFVIQGGGFTADMIQKPTKPPIKNEAGNKISNTAGTVAMARTPVVDSATSQFFINLKDNKFLDHQNESEQGYGYCVFGRVTEGMDVVAKIGNVPTTKEFHSDVPAVPVVIKSIRSLP